MIRLCLIASCLLFTSCSWLNNVNAEVTSDTSWSGNFDGRTVDGTGNQTVKMDRGSNSSGSVCAVVQKDTRSGFLTVKIGGEEKTTTAEFGVVSVCGS
jgi:hypothetical protein